MNPAKSKAAKVNAGYRLPEALVMRVKHRAVREKVRPCVIVERLIEEGLKRPDKKSAPSVATAN